MRYQQTLIQHNVTSLTSRGNLTDLKAIEVNTIDKYQGRDKECIILSFVRSNSKGNVSTKASYEMFIKHRFKTLISCLLL